MTSWRRRWNGLKATSEPSATSWTCASRVIVHDRVDAVGLDHHRRVSAGPRQGAVGGGETWSRWRDSGRRRHGVATRSATPTTSVRRCRPGPACCRAPGTGRWTAAPATNVRPKQTAPPRSAHRSPITTCARDRRPAPDPAEVQGVGLAALRAGGSWSRSIASHASSAPRDGRGRPTSKVRGDRRSRSGRALGDGRAHLQHCGRSEAIGPHLGPAARSLPSTRSKATHAGRARDERHRALARRLGDPSATTVRAWLRPGRSSMPAAVITREPRSVGEQVLDRRGEPS